MFSFDDLKKRLDQSPFRSRFKLTNRDRAYIALRGWDEIRAQARTIISQRLASAFPLNDGKQTPMRGHVVFIAQHATGCCCRGCLQKWHNIASGKALSEEEIEYVCDVLVAWLKDKAGDLSGFDQNRSLFE